MQLGIRHDLISPKSLCISLCKIGIKLHFRYVSNNYGKCRNLTHWGRVMYICVDKLTINGSDNGLSPVRRQGIIWTNYGILLIGPLGQTSVKFNRNSNIFFDEKMFENVICEMLSRSQKGFSTNPRIDDYSVRLFLFLPGNMNMDANIFFKKTLIFPSYKGNSKWTKQVQTGRNR